MRVWERWLPEIDIALTLGIATVVSLAVYQSYGTLTWAFSLIWGLATLSSVSLYFAVRRSGLDWRSELRVIFVIGLVVGVVSIFTGIGNNATDEPWAIGGYLAELAHGQDPYAAFLVVNYQVHVLSFWSNSVTSVSQYTYLPLLLFAQVPGTGNIGYEILCLLLWVGLVYVVRRDEFAAIVLASPVVALLAANGFNDLPVLFLMTLSLRGWTGPKAKVVEYVTYGMKQFANVFWFVYYVVRRDFVRGLLVLAITLAIALPFLVWDASSFYCQALTLGVGPGCPAGGARGLSDLWDHWNYYLWPLWVYALFRDPIDSALRRWRSRWKSPARGLQERRGSAGSP